MVGLKVGNRKGINLTLLYKCSTSLSPVFGLQDTFSDHFMIQILAVLNGITNVFKNVLLFKLFFTIFMYYCCLVLDHLGKVFFLTISVSLTEMIIWSDV